MPGTSKKHHPKWRFNGDLLCSLERNITLNESKQLYMDISRESNFQQVLAGPILLCNDAHFRKLIGLQTATLVEDKIEHHQTNEQTNTYRQTNKQTNQSNQASRNSNNTTPNRCNSTDPNIHLLSFSLPNWYSPHHLKMFNNPPTHPKKRTWTLTKKHLL